MSKKNIKVLVAAHKKYWMPSDEMYYRYMLVMRLQNRRLDFRGMTAAKIYQQKMQIIVN